jgi:uncharacterized protein
MEVTELNIYPVKSVKGIGVQAAVVEDEGFQYDRRWMVVDEKGNFFTQREYPLLATITVGVINGSLAFSIPGRQAVEVSQSADGVVRTVKVWRSSVKASWYDGEINEALSEYLGVKCSLTTMGPEAKRIVNPIYAVRKFRDTVSFADGYPFLVANEASLADLNSRLTDQVPMNRFRPNIVVTGADAWAEDGWKKLRIGETLFHVVKPSARCVKPWRKDRC